MKKQTVFILFLTAFFVSCSTNAQKKESKIAEKPESRSRKTNDTAIYGGLPHLPDKSFPPSAQRKTPNTPTALCNDDNYSFSRNFDYACKGHGGVKQWTYNSDIQIKSDNEKYFED